MKTTKFKKCDNKRKTRFTFFNFPIVLLLLAFLFSCKDTVQNKNESTYNKFTELNKNNYYGSKNRIILTKKLYRKYGLHAIEYLDKNDEYYISDINKNLKLIERVSKEEQISWLCLLNKNNTYQDHLRIEYCNSEGYFNATSKIIEDTITLNYWSDLIGNKDIETVQITSDAFINPTKQKKAVGNWVNETFNLSFTLSMDNNELMYTFVSPKRTLKNKAYITANGIIVFKDFTWSEYTGGAIDDQEENNQKENLVFPSEISCIIDLISNRFTIQNYVNAMNYYTKIEETSEKYITFHKQ